MEHQLYTENMRPERVNSGFSCVRCTAKSPRLALGADQEQSRASKGKYGLLFEIDSDAVPGEPISDQVLHKCQRRGYRVMHADGAVHWLERKMAA
jgi:hypothetical protein